MASNLITARDGVADHITTGNPWDGVTVTVVKSLLPIEDRPESLPGVVANVFPGGIERSQKRPPWERAYETNVAILRPVVDDDTEAPIVEAFGVSEALEDSFETLKIGCLKSTEIVRLNSFDPDMYDFLRIYAAFITIQFTEY